MNKYWFPLIVCAVLAVMISCNIPNITDEVASPTSTELPPAATSTLSTAQEDAIGQMEQDTGEEPEVLIEGGQREIYYTISDYDLEEGHIDLVTDKVLQDGDEVDYDWEPEQYLSYTIDDDVIKFFIAPSPYPRAEAGVSYTRMGGDAQEQRGQPEGEPSFDLTFAGTHPCGEWPHYAAFQVENTSDYTFESVRLMVEDLTNEQTVYASNNNRGFAEAGGCPPGDESLPPGGTAEVAANIKEPEPGTEFEATIKLCTGDGLEGECVSETVTFVFEE